MTMTGTILRNSPNVHDQDTGELVGYVNPVTGKIEAAVPRGDDAISGLPARLVARNAGLSYLYRHAATSGTMRAAWNLYAPVGGGYFTGAGISPWYGSTQKETTLGRLWLGRLGTYQHHTAGVRVGTWTTLTWDYAYGGTVSRSATAGDTITFTNVVGSDLVLRALTISNGGYAIVSIDGDWTAANRCATFTAADLAAGRCRASDVGKRYVNSYAAATCGWLDFPLADGLADTAHTVVFEVTGTKPAASGDVRAHVGGVIGCSAADAGGAPGAAGRTIAHVDAVYDSTSGSSAFLPVIEVANAAGNAYEFLGEPHEGATQTSILYFTDTTDRSAMAADTYAAGQNVRITRISTMASSDAPSTVVIDKVTELCACGRGVVPIAATSRLVFAVNKAVRWHYPLMLPATQVQIGDNSQNNTRFGLWSIGGGEWKNTQALSGGGDFGLIPGRYIEATGEHGRIAYAVLLAPEQSVLSFALSATAPVFVTDYSTYEKAYFTRSTGQSLERFFAGDIVQAQVGWGVLPHASA